jgi:hypothetical protein
MEMERLKEGCFEYGNILKYQSRLFIITQLFFTCQNILIILIIFYLFIYPFYNILLQFNTHFLSSYTYHTF